MRAAFLWASALAVLLVPPLFLAVLAFPRLISGLALDAAFPVPVYIHSNIRLPDDAYNQARRALARANESDGEAQILQAEAAYLSGRAAPGILPVLIEGLSKRPASARGWTLLTEIEAQRWPERAASALALALRIAPYDYWIAPWRSIMGAELWNELGPTDRAALLQQVRLLWSEEGWRSHLQAMLQTAQGARLVGEAFADDAETLRDLNRRVTRAGLRDVVAP